MSIVLDQISKQFGNLTVVNRVSLEIARGELFVLLGGSGSGKSTILKMIAGLLAPDEGKISIAGNDVTALAPQRRNVGFVFQHYAVFRHMSVAENIEFGLKVRKISKAQRTERRDELLDLVGLSGLGSRLPSQLSGGQLQRVALARALAYKPQVLLLDEPFGALDMQVRTQLRRSLRLIQDELKVTTILVTHDQDEAFELGDRVAVLHRGGLVEVGEPSALYHSPRTDHVAAFIGGGNVLVGRKNGAHIQLGSITLGMPETAKKHQEGAPVRVLFRPEDVVLSSEPSVGLASLGQGLVTDRSFAGAVERARVEVADLRGARALAPYPSYGQKSPEIEVSYPSTEMSRVTGTQVYLGLKRFHVLDPHGLNSLSLLHKGNFDDGALSFGALVASASHGTAYLFCNTDRSEFEAARKSARTLGESLLPPGQVEVVAREGDLTQVFVSESQRGVYDFVILGREGGDSLSPEQIRSLSLRLLSSARIPLVIAHRNTKTVSRILVCTAAGEPGKSDVLFGARLARHFRAHVTVLHVQRTHVAENDARRAERHLQSAARSLSAMGLEHDVQVQSGDASLVIPEIMRNGRFDLIVFGAAGSASKRALLFLQSLIEQADCSVAIVPMSAP